MGRLLSFLACALLSTAARADTDFDLTLDLRAVTSRGLPSYLNGGLGKLRFDPAHDGLRLGQLRLAVRTPVTDTLAFTAEATTWGDHDKQDLDLIEAVFDWRPLPNSLWRSNVRAGVARTTRAELTEPSTPTVNSSCTSPAVPARNASGG